MITKEPDICEFCGCNLEVEEEMFSGDKLWTGHSCRGSEEEQEKILRVLSGLRQNGLPCFLATGLITDELWERIMGKG